jgi:hypothetical protein
VLSSSSQVSVMWRASTCDLGAPSKFKAGRLDNTTPFRFGPANVLTIALNIDQVNTSDYRRAQSSDMGSTHPKTRYEVWHIASRIVRKRSQLLIDFRLQNAIMSIRKVRFSPVSQYIDALGGYFLSGLSIVQVRWGGARKLAMMGLTCIL